MTRAVDRPTHRPLPPHPRRVRVGGKGVDVLGCVKQYNAIMTTIAFKVTEDLNTFIRQQATARNTTISDFIRGTFEAMRPKRGCKIVKRNGYLVVEHPPGTPQITDADIRAAEDADDITEAAR